MTTPAAGPTGEPKGASVNVKTPGTEKPAATTSGGPGVVKKTTDTFRRIVLVLLGAFAALFAVFNSRNVEVRWFIGDPIQTPLILVIAVCLAVGFLAGWIVGRVRSGSGK